MGQLLGRKIVQSRIWINPEDPVLPDLDYELTYPRTVFDAVHETMDDDSPTLTRIIQVINSNIDACQKIIKGGRSGNVMAWTDTPGEVGEMSVATEINTAPDMRSNKTLVTEKAVGAYADRKLPIPYFENHVRDVDKDSVGSHVSDAERDKWNDCPSSEEFKKHTENSSIHVSEEERRLWSNMANAEELNAHILDYNNPHRTTAAQINTYEKEVIDQKIEDVAPKFFNYKNITVDPISDNKKTYGIGIYNPVNKDPAAAFDYHWSDIYVQGDKPNSWKYTGPDGVVHEMPDGFKQESITTEIPPDAEEAFVIVEKYPYTDYPLSNEIQIWRRSKASGESAPWTVVAGGVTITPTGKEEQNKVTVHTGDLFSFPDFKNNSDPWLYLWMGGRFVRLLTAKDDINPSLDELKKRVELLEQRLTI